MINVTKSYLPPLAEYVAHLEGIWERGQLTNSGPLVMQLEEQLRSFLGVKYCFLLNNGTIALQLAIKSLDLEGEIITTPFSYVATTSSIVWENCIPIFVDINSETLCLDPGLIEAAITPRTSAIMATHVYGNPCDVEAITLIAKKHNLKVIYDAAHAFGVLYKGQSILNFGDVSTLSFHATKLFHTIEGGAVVTNDDATAHRLSYMRNFGHNGPEEFWGVGINGKNSEVHAAMGLCVLPRVPELIARRTHLSELYDKLLSGCNCRRPVIHNDTDYNYSYYALVMQSEAELLHVRDALNAVEIFPRRYFYPSLNTLDYVLLQKVPVSEDISRRVLCLPLYPDLTDKEVHQVCETTIQSLRIQHHGIPNQATVR